MLGNKRKLIMAKRNSVVIVNPYRQLNSKMGITSKALGFRLTKGCGFENSELLPISCEYGTQLLRDRRRGFAVIPRYIPAVLTTQNKVIALASGVRTFLTGYDGESVLD